MTAECIIEIRPQGAKLDLVVKAPGLGDNVRTYPRALPDIRPADLNLLRSGRVSAPDVNAIATKVSRWLQYAKPRQTNPDLDLDLLLGLGLAQGEPVRIVFSVRDIPDDRAMLRYFLTDIPVELARIQGHPVELALHQRVASIVHLLPKVGPGPKDADWGRWPLRVLIVRSNPKSLGGQVPDAQAIRMAIREARADLGGDALRIDVLSREDAPDIAGLPTRDGLLAQAEKRYDILVYLGHGDVRQAHEDQLPIGVLQLEDPNGERPDDLEASQLSTLLHKHPVPVVLLVGCLTAAEPPPGDQEALDKQRALDQAVARWMQGSHAVAQALINGYSGVEFVVGMRYRIEVQDGTRFLRSFFRSLLKKTPNGLHTGDLEAAVREARQDLKVLSNQAISWAAPVVFRTLGNEPTFPFLATPPAPPKVEDLARSLIWETLAEMRWATRADPNPDSSYRRRVARLDQVEQELLTLVKQQGAVPLLPQRNELPPEALAPAPGRTTVEMVVELHDGLQARVLQGTLVAVGPENCVIWDVKPAPAAAAGGFILLTSRMGERTVVFQLQRTGNAAGALPRGPLLTVTLEIGAGAGAVYTLNVEGVWAEPARSIWGGSNALIVPPAV